MENLNINELIKNLEDAILYDQQTGKLHSPDERLDNLDAIRERLAELGDIFNHLDDLEVSARMVLAATFIRVTDTYFDIVKKHEDLVAAGK